jgi:hypothetical protein
MSTPEQQLEAAKVLLSDILEHLTEGPATASEGQDLVERIKSFIDKEE